MAIVTKEDRHTAALVLHGSYESKSLLAEWVETGKEGSLDAYDDETWDNEVAVATYVAAQRETVAKILESLKELDTKLNRLIIDKDLTQAACLAQQQQMYKDHALANLKPANGRPKNGSMKPTILSISIVK
jgi:hypothetical protein